MTDEEESEALDDMIKLSHGIAERLRAWTPRTLAERIRLKRLRATVVTARDTLERILDDDDLAQPVITDETNIIPAKGTGRTMLDELRRPFLEQIQKLSFHERSLQELDDFFIEQIWLEPFPADRQRKTREFCGKPSHLSEDFDQIVRRIAIDGDDDPKLARIEKDIHICGLMEGLRQKYRRHIGEMRQRSMKALGRDIRTPETIRTEAFALVARICGKPERLIARVYDALDWNDQSVTGGMAIDGVMVTEKAIGPRARRENLIATNLIPDEPESKPLSRGWIRELARNHRVDDDYKLPAVPIQNWREVMTKQIYDAFLSLRAELARYHTEQAAKTGRDAQVRRRIEQLQRSIAA